MSDPQSPQPVSAGTAEPTPEATADPAAVSLVEDVSIDGMCGVY